MRTPFRSPLGPTKASAAIEKYIPVGSVVSTYGFYSGEAELYLSNRNRFILSHTTKEAVFDIWQTLFDDPVSVSEIASRILPFKGDKDFEILQEQWYKYRNAPARAALFFVLNNCSDSAYISKGKLDLSNYNPVSLSRLKKFIKPENFHLQLIENVKQNIIEDNRSDILFFHTEKYKKDFLSEGFNRGVEEENMGLREILASIENKKYVILTTPSPFLSELDIQNTTFIDQYGRETTEANAKEIILHNV